MFSTRVSIGGAEIAARDDFGFQLRRYVIAPELREAQKLIEIVHLSSGGLVKVDVASRGTVDAPLLDLTVLSGGRWPRRRSMGSASGWPGT